MNQLGPNPESVGTANTDMKFVFDTIHELHDGAIESTPPESIRTLGSYLLQFQFSSPRSSDELLEAARTSKQENGVAFVQELTIANFVPPASSEINPSDDRTAIGSQGYGDGSTEFFLKAVMAVMSDRSSIKPALKIDSAGQVLRVNNQVVVGDIPAMHMQGAELPATYRRGEHDKYTDDGEVLDPTHNDVYRDKIVRVFRTLRLQEARAQLVQTSALDNLYPLDAPKDS